MSSAGSRWRAAEARLDPLDLAPRLVLLALLYEPTLTGFAWFTRGPLVLLAVAGLLLPPLHRSAALLGAVAAVLVAKTARDASFQDNHVFLLACSALALALAATTPDPRRTLATSARWLIGLSFALAVLWKAFLSPDFRSGAYIEYTLLTDPRFAELSMLAGGMSEADLAFDRIAADTESSEAGIRLRTRPALESLAGAVTVWTLAIEGALALAFLWPLDRGPSRLRDPLLLLFCATTYLVATVPTFGWTLLTLGIAQLSDVRRAWLPIYLIVLAGVVAYAYVPVLATLRALVPE